MKIYKKGTLISYEIGSNTFGGCDANDEMVLEKDYTEDELETYLHEMAVEYLSPYATFNVEKKK